jgi:hypothetical protein
MPDNPYASPIDQADVPFRALFAEPLRVAMLASLGAVLLTSLALMAMAPLTFFELVNGPPGYWQWAARAIVFRVWTVSWLPMIACLLFDACLGGVLPISQCKTEHDPRETLGARAAKPA